MRIHIKNFRCYEDKVFDFGETGLTLLSGPSGAGKSTIMFAIHFALFGVGNKLQMHGKKSCSVELVIDDLKIVRSKGPVRLVVNDIYEDDAAESIIQERFGKLFSSVSYIPQDLKDSFVVMTPANRLLFLEKFAFGDVDIGEIKGRVKGLIRNLSDEHIKISGNLEFAIKILEETMKPEEVVFPIKCKRDQRDKAMREFTTQTCLTLFPSPLPRPCRTCQFMNEFDRRSAAGVPVKKGMRFVVAAKYNPSGAVAHLPAPYGPGSAVARP
jgi:hypothetical protein